MQHPAVATRRVLGWLLQSGDARNSHRRLRTHFRAAAGIDRRRPLDAGTPDQGVAKRTQRDCRLKPRSRHAEVVDRDMAACCIAGVWLLHDFLDESHTISQGIDTPSGSFWHAIMHRREGDFSNAKYWFRHVGRHPVFDALGVSVRPSLLPRRECELSEKLAYVRATGIHSRSSICARRPSAADATTASVCLDIQQAEWELLFDYCYRGGRR